MVKSGSTTIQKFLEDNRDAVAEAGLFIPLTGTIQHAHNHRSLVAAFSPQKNGNRLLGPLRREFRQAGLPPRALLTAENFSLRFPETGYVDKLAQYWTELGYDLHVAAYLRAQPGAINSRYCQNLKHWTHAMTMTEFAAAEIQSGRHDYSSLFAEVVDHSGIATSFRPFSRRILQTGLVADFLQVIGVAEPRPGAFAETGNFNRSPGAKTVAALLALRRWTWAELPHLTGRELSPLTTPLIKIADGMGWNDRPFYGVDADLHRSIVAHFADSNERMARRAWNCSWRNHFADEEEVARPLSVFDPQSAEGPERDEWNEFVAQAKDMIHHFTSEKVPSATDSGQDGIEDED